MSFPVKKSLIALRAQQIKHVASRETAQLRSSIGSGVSHNAPFKVFTKILPNTASPSIYAAIYTLFVMVNEGTVGLFHLGN